MSPTCSMFLPTLARSLTHRPRCRLLQALTLSERDTFQTTYTTIPPAISSLIDNIFALLLRCASFQTSYTSFQSNIQRFSSLDPITKFALHEQEGIPMLTRNLQTLTREVAEITHDQHALECIFLGLVKEGKFATSAPLDPASLVPNLTDHVKPYVEVKLGVLEEEVGEVRLLQDAAEREMEEYLAWLEEKWAERGVGRELETNLEGE